MSVLRNLKHFTITAVKEISERNFLIGEEQRNLSFALFSNCTRLRVNRL